MSSEKTDKYRGRICFGLFMWFTDNDKTDHKTGPMLLKQQFTNVTDLLYLL